MRTYTLLYQTREVRPIIERQCFFRKKVVYKEIWVRKEVPNITEEEAKTILQSGFPYVSYTPWATLLRKVMGDSIYNIQLKETPYK